MYSRFLMEYFEDFYDGFDFELRNVSVEFLDYKIG